MDKQNSPGSFSMQDSVQGKSRAQALVEFALALPVLLALVFGIIDFALIFQAWLSVENVARQTVRYAVTGEYNVENCSDYNPGPPKTGCTGTDYLQKQDAARLISIQQEAQRWEVALFKNSTTSTAAKGYLHVTICSNRDADHSGASDFTHTIPVMGGTIYAQCLPNEDAGSPGDNVFVFVDFNHPLITPFLNQVWPMLHIVSYRQGVVETFRTSRSIVQPGEGIEPSTDTPTPSDTPVPPTSTHTLIPPSPTKTRTPTITPTPDCSQFSFSGGFSQSNLGGGGNQPRVQITVVNGSTQATAFSSLTFDWHVYDLANPSQTLNRIRYNNSTLPNGGGTDDTNSPTTWAGSLAFPAGSSGPLQFDYNNVDANWPGTVPPTAFGLTVGFANGCTIRIDATSFSTLTPTLTLVPSRTPSPTITLTASKTPLPSKTPTKTPVTPTKSPTPVTPSKTPTPVTPSKSPTPVTPSKTPTQIIIPTKTPTPVPSRTPVTPIGWVDPWI